MQKRPKPIASGWIGTFFVTFSYLNDTRTIDGLQRFAVATPYCSLCHGWASAPIPLLIEEIVGHKPTAPGWKEYRFSPRIPKGMPDFRLAFRTARGVFRVQCRNGQAQLEAS